MVVDFLADAIGIVAIVLALAMGASHWITWIRGKAEDDFWMVFATGLLILGALLTSHVGPFVLAAVIGATIVILFAAWQTVKKRQDRGNNRFDDE